MSVISTTTKRKAGVKAASAAAKRPRLLVSGARVARPAGKLELKASKPTIERQARRRVDQLGEAAQQLSEAVRTTGRILAVDGPAVAYALGLAEPPKPKRTAPRVAVGIVIGASAMYLLDAEHREKVAQLVS